MVQKKAQSKLHLYTPQQLCCSGKVKMAEEDCNNWRWLAIGQAEGVHWPFKDTHVPIVVGTHPGDAAGLVEERLGERRKKQAMVFS